MKTIEDLIKELFDHLCGKQLVSCIKYPFYSDNETKRISEQEAKQVFIHLLEKYKISYSVETPTINKYKFGDSPVLDKNGISARIDVSTYSNDTVDHHIEFKALNPDIKCYTKDFLKLYNEGKQGGINYFIHIISKGDKGTINSLSGKYFPCKEYTNKSDKTVKVYIVNLDKKKYLQF
jgi:hypothetical protein